MLLITFYYTYKKMLWDLSSIQWEPSSMGVASVQASNPPSYGVLPFNENLTPWKLPFFRPASHQVKIILYEPHKIHSNKLNIVYMIIIIQNSLYYHTFCYILTTETLEIPDWCLLDYTSYRIGRWINFYLWLVIT